MHGEPDTELEFEGFWQQAHQIRILLCEPHLADTDAEARLDCAQLRDVAVGSEGKAKGIGTRHRLRMARIAGVSRSKPIKLCSAKSVNPVGVQVRAR